MKRSTRAELGKETVDIVGRGSYRSASGREVDVAEAIRACLNATRYYRPDDLEQIRGSVLDQGVTGPGAVFEVVNETTLSGAARVLAGGHGPVAVLNFASAKNPGGGFLNGSQAQEESLARSSALYASQMRAWDFYENHRALPSLLYSDAMILSPGCPVFRDDEGALLEEPRIATIITSAAPNASAAAKNRPSELPLIPEVFRKRSEYILALAASRGYRNLVLGAWGCGVFGNDPRVVAESFAAHLKHDRWSARFDRVVFSVLDTSPSRSTFAAFQKAFSARV